MSLIAAGCADMPTSVATREHEHSHRLPPSSIKYPFWFGGSSSCFAACVTHPLDLVKVRLQTRAPDAPKGMVGTFVHVLQNNGIRGLYSGLSASLLRQITYSTTRFGVYEKLKQSTSSSPSFLELVWMASASGFLGGVAGNPADIINVRMQNDASLPASQRRNYRNAIDGLVRMSRDEGIRVAFRGVMPNSLRAMLMTASQLATYDSIKSALMNKFHMKDNLATHFTASTAAGFIATTICSPVDVVKTRVMSATEKESIFSLLGRIYRAEGISWMFRGWLPSFIRLGPHTVATFIFLEQHKELWRWAMVPETKAKE